MFLCKEITDYSLQFLSGRLPHGVIPPEAGRQTETVINAKDDKQHCRRSHYDSPCMKSRLMRRCTGSLALDNQDELVKKYNHKFLVIKNCEVIGDYNTYEEALFETSKEHELGTFLIQECTEGDSAYTQTFHSRVIFV